MKSKFMQTIAVGFIAGLVASAVHWLTVGQSLQSEVDRLERLYEASERGSKGSDQTFASSAHPSSRSDVRYDPNRRPTGLPPGYSTPDITDRQSRSACEQEPDKVELLKFPESTVPSMVPGIIYEPPGGSTVPSMVPGIIYESSSGSSVAPSVPGVINDGAEQGETSGVAEGAELGAASDTDQPAGAPYTLVRDSWKSVGPQGVPGAIYRIRKERQYADGLLQAVWQRQIEKFSVYFVRSITRLTLP